MPTPLEILFDPISLCAIGIFASLILWEMMFPARVLLRVRFWRTRGLIAFAVYFFLSSYLPLWWDAYLVQWQVFDLSRLSTVLQFFIGLGIYELVLYIWHRSLHSVNWLWRSFHQMHHSAERLDTYGAFWFSPLDMVGFTLVGSVALTLGIGVNPQAATAILLVTFFLAIFQHANIHTPRWLGYFVQRPESHSYHHAKNIHRHNYADLPLFDLLFGTFVNPRAHRDTGFYAGASGQVIDMLLWRDLNKTHTENSIRLEAI